jgi:hypothetical protein
MHKENFSRLFRRIRIHFHTLNIRAGFATVITIGLVAGLAQQSMAENWQPRLNKDGIVVESRSVKGLKYQEFKAVTEIEGTVAQAIAILKDNSACERWLFRCKESRLVKEISNTERTFYQVTSLPFPIKSRDAIFHADTVFAENGSVRVNLKALPKLLEESKKHVRVQEAKGYYLLEPLTDSTTRITWQQYVDPAGALPAWLVNSMLTDLPFKSLGAFKKLVVQPPYTSAVVVRDEDGKPIDIVMTDL